MPLAATIRTAVSISSRQVGLPHHFAFHQKRQLEGETKHGGQQQRVKGRVLFWCGNL
jgi:hypothetical protein